MKVRFLAPVAQGETWLLGAAPSWGSPRLPQGSRANVPLSFLCLCREGLHPCFPEMESEQGWVL